MSPCGEATRGWSGARLAGIAVLLTSWVLVAGASAAPGGEPGKPDSQPSNPPQGTQGNPGGSRAEEVRAEPEPEPQAQSKADPPAPEPQGPNPKSEPQPTSAKGGSGHAGGPPARANRGSSDTSVQSGGSDRSQSRANREAGTNVVKSNPQDRGPRARTTFCHSTRSATNPYVVITTNNNGLPTAHVRHHDGDDIIPATNGECPGGTTPTTTERPTDGEPPGEGAPRGLGGPERTGDGPGADGPGEEDGPGLNGIDGVDGIDGRERPGDEGAPEDGVLGERETNPGDADGVDEGGSAPAIAEEGPADGGESLPFTGLGLGAMLALALLALAGGVATRRISRE